MKSTRIEENTQPENPVYTMLFMGMTLKAWAKYAHKKTEAMKAAAANQMEYFSSDNSDQDEYEENYQLNDLKSKEDTEEEVENDEIIEEEDPEYEQSPMKIGARTPVGFQDTGDRNEKSLFENISFVHSENKHTIFDEQREKIKNLEPMKINVKKVENESQISASRDFSVNEDEEGRSQNIINYNINNNFIINNNYYYGSSGGDGMRHEVNVEMHQEVQINKIKLKKIEQ